MRLPTAVGVREMAEEPVLGRGTLGRNDHPMKERMADIVAVE